MNYHTQTCLEDFAIERVFERHGPIDIYSKNSDGTIREYKINKPLNELTDEEIEFITRLGNTRGE